MARMGCARTRRPGLYWMSVRAYDPMLGRFISRDPLNRTPLMGWSDQPYAYAGNNPLLNVDPSGQRFAAESGAQTRAAMGYARRVARTTRVQATRGCRRAGSHPTCAQIDNAKRIADKTATDLYTATSDFHFLDILGALALLQGWLRWSRPWWIPGWLAAAATRFVAAVVAAVVAIQIQLAAAAVLFKLESWAPDSFWQNDNNIGVFAGSVGVVLSLLGIAITVAGFAIAALATNPLTFAIGAGLFIGGMVGLIRVLRIAQDGIAREERALGYRK